MKEQNKQLLLKDLCARLPYGVKCRFISSKGDIPSTIVKVDIENETVSHKPEGQSVVYFHWIESGNIKPYLRQMSSMTEEEKEELKQEHIKDEKLYAECLTKAANGDDSMRGKVITHFAADWCNKNHFDFRGLIPMGLALEAPEGMYELK